MIAFSYVSITTESCLDVCGEAGPCEEACGTNGVCCKKGYQQDGCNGRVGRRTGKCITVGTDEPEDPEEPEEPEIELTGLLNLFIVLENYRGGKHYIIFIKSSRASDGL